MSDKVRLQKYIAECGVASRRKAEGLIAAGRVAVNGKVVAERGVSIDPDKDEVIVDGKKLAKERPIYIKIYKPRGVISSCKGYGKETVMDLVKDIPHRLYPVGRLDKDSEGLMILTNDGALANRLMHPRFEHEKEYFVNVKCPIPRQSSGWRACRAMTNEQMKVLSSGIILEGKKTLPAKTYRVGPTSFRIILKEGRKRQIRKMVEAAGHRVKTLKRVRIKNIKLDKLGAGEYAYLTPGEIANLRN